MMVRVQSDDVCMSCLKIFHSLKLKNEEHERKACVEAVEREQVRVRQLQEELRHERLNSQQVVEQNTHTQEV